MGVDLGPRRGGVGARLVGGRLGRAAGLAVGVRRRAHSLELGFRGPRRRLVRLELGPDALEQPPRPVRVGARLLGRRLGRSQRFAVGLRRGAHALELLFDGPRGGRGRLRLGPRRRRVVARF